MQGFCIQSFTYLTKTLDYKVKEKKFWKLFFPGDQSDTYILDTNNRFIIEKSYLAMSCGDESISVDGEFAFTAAQSNALFEEIERLFFFRRSESEDVARLYSHYLGSSSKISNFITNPKSEHLSLNKKSGKGELIFHLNRIRADLFTLGIVIQEDR